MNEYPPKQDGPSESDRRYHGSLEKIGEETTGLGRVQKTHGDLNQKLRRKDGIPNKTILPHEQGRN